MPITNIKNRHFSVEKRKEALLHAKKIGNISATCLTYGINRTTFYKWQKCYELDIFNGLSRKKGHPSVHPFKTKPEVATRVLDFSLTNPTLGCSKIAAALMLENIKISSPTVQKILMKEKLGTVSKRLFRLEEEHIKHGLKISTGLLEKISKNDPCFKELNKIGSYPGEILVQDTFPIFGLSPNTYIHVVIDTYSSYAFVYPWAEKSPELAIDLLRTKVLRFFRGHHFIVKKIITDCGYEFTRFNKSYGKYLYSQEICHEIYSGNKKNWNGFIERYKKSFFKHNRIHDLSNLDIMSKNEVIQSIKNDRRNAQRIVNGYPNFGMSPLSYMNRTSDKDKSFTN